MEQREIMRCEWISWDNHRRTVTLAKHMGTRLTVLKRSKWPFLNPWVPLARTLLHLASTHCEIIIVQNPSLLLTTIACLMKPLKGYRLVQDLHSYFMWIDSAKGVRAGIYRKLSSFCIRRSDLSIVTNEFLSASIRERGGRGFVLQDRVPDLGELERRPLRAAHNVVFICTYSEDEPLQEVLEAGGMLDDSYHIYITGRPRRTQLPLNLPKNVTCTGFLPDREYLELLNSADALMTLTTNDHTLLCGAYEAVALSKPLILSGTEALRNYFKCGAVYVTNDADSISQAIQYAVSNGGRLSEEITQLSGVLMEDWNARFQALLRELGER